MTEGRRRRTPTGARADFGATAWRSEFDAENGISSPLKYGFGWPGLDQREAPVNEDSIFGRGNHPHRGFGRCPPVPAPPESLFFNGLLAQLPQ